LDQFLKENRMPAKQLSAEAKSKLMKYPFPGNVRELRSIMELAAVMADGNEIMETDINFTAIRGDDFLLAEEKTMKEFTTDIIKHYLKKYDDNIMTVAEKLDIGKSTIYKMLQQKEIERQADK
jgi:DNA-binding NtrC family response regulator